MYLWQRILLIYSYPNSVVTKGGDDSVEGGVTLQQKALLCVLFSSCFHLCFAHGSC